MYKCLYMKLLFDVVRVKFTSILKEIHSNHPAIHAKIKTRDLTSISDYKVSQSVAKVCLSDYNMNALWLKVSKSASKQPQMPTSTRIDLL
jgi:hypothetical protein